VTPEIALINAVRTLLKNDGGVLALVDASKIFDQVDEKTKAPYVYVGPAGRQRIISDCGQVWTVRLRVYAISSEYNRNEDWDLAEATVQALDQQEPILADPFVLNDRLNVTQAGDVIDPNAPKSVFVDLTATIARAT
jgi:hypothetical protein